MAKKASVSPKGSRRLSGGCSRRNSLEKGLRRSSVTAVAPENSEPLLLQIHLMLLFAALAYFISLRAPLSWTIPAFYVVLAFATALAGYHAKPQLLLPSLLCFIPYVAHTAAHVCLGLVLFFLALCIAMLLLEPFLPSAAITGLVIICAVAWAVPIQWIAGSCAFALLWCIAIYAVTTFHNRSNLLKQATVAACLALPAIGIVAMQLIVEESTILTNADSVLQFMTWGLIVAVGFIFGKWVAHRFADYSYRATLGATVACAIIPVLLGVLLPNKWAISPEVSVAILFCLLDTICIQLLVVTAQVITQFKGALFPGLCCVASMAFGTFLAGYTPAFCWVLETLLSGGYFAWCLAFNDDAHCWTQSPSLSPVSPCLVALLYNVTQPLIQQQLMCIPEVVWSVEYNTFHLAAPDPPSTPKFPTSDEVHHLKRLATEIPRLTRKYYQREHEGGNALWTLSESPDAAFKILRWEYWQTLATMPAATLIEVWDRLLAMAEETGASQAKLLNGCLRTWEISVQRDSLLPDAVNLFSGASLQQLLCYNLRVQFAGEDGLDFGGLAREFFSRVSAELIKPERQLFEANEYAVWRPLYTENYTFETHKAYVAVGRILAMAIMQGHCIDVSLPTWLYKVILGKPVTAKDTKEVDPLLYRNRFELLLEEGGLEMVNDALGEPLHFVCLEHPSGKPVPLEPGGEDRLVTNENKLEYLEKLANFYIFHDCEEQVLAILIGFWQVIPLEVLQELNLEARDLQLILTGVPAIDVDQWRIHTALTCHDKQEEALVGWFFDILQEFDHQQRARLLAFCTGASKVPPDGFKPLNFKLCVDRDPQHLPASHTCTSTLLLPLCPNKETLRGKLLFIVHDDFDFSFGLA